MDGLDHCVGGYTKCCVRDGVRILSVRETLPNGDQRRLAIAEAEMTDAGLVVRQLLGLRNGAPPDMAVRALVRQALLAGDAPAGRGVDTVAERHRALNWLTGFQNSPDTAWDDVDVPT